MQRFSKTFAWWLACIGVGPAAAEVPTTQPVDVIPVRQTWASSEMAYDDTDSVAVCHGTNAELLVLATSKKGNRVDAFAGATGRHVSTFGKTGTAPGEFRRPNGIITVRLDAGAGTSPMEVVMVIERDNHRVQAFRPGTWESIGLFGDVQLTRPYGAGISYAAGGPYLYVTQTLVPPGQTVQVFRLSVRDGSVFGEHVRAFGDTDGPGAIVKPESIIVDDELDRVLICDEEPGRKAVRVYSRRGVYSGRSFSAEDIQGDPEGIALIARGSAGFVLLTDQQKAITIWHVYDRESLRHIAAFIGQPAISNTDGICVWAREFPGFPAGALFAINNDRDIRAYDLAAIIDLAVKPRRP